MYLFQGSCFACWRLLQELVLLGNLEYISKSCMRSHGKQILNARPQAVAPGELVPVGEEPQCHMIYLSGQRGLDFMYLQSNISWNKYPNRVVLDTWYVLDVWIMNKSEEIPVSSRLFHPWGKRIEMLPYPASHSLSCSHNTSVFQMHLPFQSTFQMLINSDHSLARKGNIIPCDTGEEDKDVKKFPSLPQIS